MTLTPGFSFIIRNFPGSFELTKGPCPPPQSSPCESTTYILKNTLKKYALGLPWWRSGWESAC